MPFSISVVKWQKSTIGNYIEFLVRVKYQEGVTES